jgi:protoheme IX farnesyltransferase
MPVLIGWAAVTNSLSLTALAFFMVIFFWTPPHFWSLAIKYKDDYSAAGIPMRPVVATKARVHKEMWFHTIMMIACSIWLIISAGLAMWSMVVTVLLGLVFARELIALKEGSENYAKTAAKIFQWSITYLSLLSVVLVAAQLTV